MSTFVYEPDGDRFIPSDLATGYWDQEHQAGGPLAGLIAHGMERFEPGWSEVGGDVLLARATIELLRPVPMEPVSVDVRAIAVGRRTHRLEASLRCDGVEMGRATGLRLTPAPVELPGGHDLHGPAEPPGPDAPWESFHVSEPTWTTLLDGCEVRVVEGSWDGAGTCTAWFRMEADFVAGVGTTPLTRTVALADYCVGLGRVLPFERYTHPNADLNVHLHRYPAGPWVGIRALMWASERGHALADGTIHDVDGMVGCATQSCVLSAR